MSEPIISVSGLRGILGESLTPDVAIRYATAFAELVPPGALVITRDGRASGEMIAHAVHAGLHAIGRDTIEAEIAATPTTGILIRQHGAAGGIQISASHNPLQYNGLKLFSQDGRIIPNAFGQKVLARYRTANPDWVGYQRIGASRSCPDSLNAHLEAVLATVDVARIAAARFHVVLDSNHGAGSLLGQRLLESLGCRVSLFGGEPDGQFEHPAEPTAENLQSVLTAVPQAKADVGFCQDPDADRLAVIDRSGRYLGEEYTLSMCVDHVLRRQPGPVVVNCSSSRMTEDLADRYGVPYIRSAVGEANVVDAILEHSAVFGGEGNGGPIDPRVGLVRDSFVGMALLLDAMSARELPIGGLADELPRYEIVKTKIPLPDGGVDVALDAIESHFDAERSDRLDGLRLDWPGRWLLVRASNTEPIIRAIAEAKTLETARGLCEEAASVLDRVVC